MEEDGERHRAGGKGVDEAGCAPREVECHEHADDRHRYHGKPVVLKQRRGCRELRAEEHRYRELREEGEPEGPRGREAGSNEEGLVQHPVDVSLARVRIGYHRKEREHEGGREIENRLAQDRDRRIPPRLFRACPVLHGYHVEVRHRREGEGRYEARHAVRGGPGGRSLCPALLLQIPCERKYSKGDDEEPGQGRGRHGAVEAQAEEHEERAEAGRGGGPEPYGGAQGPEPLKDLEHPHVHRHREREREPGPDYDDGRGPFELEVRGYGSARGDEDGT